MSVQETIAFALNQYRAGDLPGAEETFRRLVETHRDSADGQCYLGIVQRARGNLQGALASYREAVRLRPDFTEAHNNLGNVLVLLGRHEEAIASYREALRLRPDYPQAHNGLGAALRHLGRLDDAAACYRRALRLWPDYADALNNLGDVFYRLGKPDEALPYYQHALRVWPDFAEARNNLGAALTRLGKPEEAIAHHREALRLKPGFADACNNLANALLAQKQFAEAVAAYREALRLQPDWAEAHSNLGIAFAKQRDWPTALACYEHALRLKPDYAEALTNKGNVLVECGRANEALACYERALALKPDYAEASDNLAQAFLALGRLDDAVACFDKALQLRPDYPEAHMGRALAWLTQGDYERGWLEYEWRWKCREFGGVSFTQPAWDGSPLEGRSILLYAEQGLGDTLQFVRYAPLVKQRGGTVILACQKPLLRLLAHCPGIDRLVAREDPLPDCDLHAPLLSLPRLFGTTTQTIPAQVPYLSAEQQRVEHWRQELAGYPEFKVGIAWQGNPRFGADRQRSFPLSHFEPLACLPGVRLFSLQKKDGLEQLRACPFPVVDLGPRLDESSGPFLDTAAVMKCLDLVICPNSALAHLAGALGVPVWLPLSLAPEWRWLWGRDDSPWYPTARLFRQERPGDWAGVFARLADALAQLVPADRRGTERERLPRVDTTAESMAAALRCHQAGNFTEAERLYRQVLQGRPDHVDAHNNRGVVLETLGRLDEAAACYRETLRLRPDYAGAHNNLGATLVRLGKPDEAIPHYRHALRLQPDLAATHNNLGAALTQLGKSEEAIAHFKQALRLQPGFADACNNLADALLVQRKFAEAMDAYREALRLNPDLLAAHNNLSVALAEQRNWEAALACCEEALRRKPDYPEALTNKGNCLLELGQPAEALAFHERALALKPDHIEAYINRAQAFLILGRLNDALACYHQALELRPDYAAAHLHRGLTWLAQGDYERGWPEYEWRWKCRAFTSASYRQPAWDGSPLAGRTILLYAEQGLGDTLQFVRYAPLVKQRGGTVVLACQKPLLRLLANCPGVDQLVAQGEELPPFDTHAPLLRLPRLFGTTVPTIPAQVPYLSADSKLVEHWRGELATYPGFKIGIAWQGSPNYVSDRQRSFPLSHFEPLACLPGVRLFSLQKKDGLEQLRDCPFPVVDLGPRLDESSGPFLDTAAVMKCLDLVICPNSALAHLAGALGVPVWLPLSLAPEWRWLWGRDDSPWYPTARLFRQERPGDWTGVFARLADALAQLVPASASGAERESPPRVDTTAETVAAGLRCHQAGNFTEAERLYRQILQTNPDNPDALHLLGLIAHQTGRPDAARSSIERAVRLKPDWPEALSNLGAIHAQQGRLNEAVDCFRQALRLAPNRTATHANLGSALVKLGQPAEAEKCFRLALSLQPDNADAHANLGMALTEQGRLDEALASCDQALRLRPDLAAAHYHRGLTFGRQKKWQQAVECYRQAVRYQPAYADAHNNLGAALEQLGRLDEALACYEQTVRLKPDSAEAYNNRAAALSQLGRLQEALADYDRTLRLKPDFAEAHQSRAMLWLVQGDYERGWPEFEWRHRCPGDVLPPFRQPAWDGSPLAGRGILLYAEQGLGDTLQFVRYAPLVKQRGGTVILACQKPLLRLLAHCPGIDRLVAREDPLPDCDLHAPLLSLPRLFGTTVATIPAKVPYLSAEQQRVEHWRQELAGYPEFKVGIAWQGNPRFGADRQRSFPLSHFASLACLPGVRLFSLQKKDGLEQLRECPFPVVDLGPRLDESSGPFLDTAAVMKCLDLVICPNSALAHLAGALGVPVWLPLSLAPEWRWLWGRDDSPWYPTARLFRQERPGDWPPVFARLADALAQLVRAGRRGQDRQGAEMAGRRVAMGTGAELMAEGLCCYQAGDLQGATQAYRGAVQAAPGNAEAWCWLGIVCRGRGDLEEAAASYREAVRLRPDFLEAHNNLGNVLVLLGRHEEAMASYREALRLRPDYPQAHNGLGAALRHLGRLDEAAACYRQALRLYPDYPDALNNLGDVLSQMGRLDEATGHYRQALRLRPNFPAAHNNLGAALRQQGHLIEAERSFRQALQLLPSYAEAHSNLGLVLGQQGRLDDAVAGYREALRLKPDSIESRFHLAQALRAQGKRDEALAHYRQLLELQPDTPEAHLSRALTWLLLGNFEQGWPEYEWRLQCRDFYRPPLSRPRWDGSPLAGRTVLLHAEQGLGDTIQFVRYAPLVKQRGGTVVLACQKPLLRLLATCPGVDRLVAADAEPPPFDVHTSLLSLPALFGTTLATVPAEVPFLSADPVLVEHWRQELAACAGLKVGIAWQGNPRHTADVYRSFPLARFEPLARVPGVQLISLQKGPGTEQLRDSPFPVVDLGPRLDEDSGPFADTAAVMKALDLVVTVDSALAHLAGALGVPTWLVLSSAADFRWMMERADSPWYPTLTLFRQEARGDDAVFTRVAAALRERRDQATAT